MSCIHEMLFNIQSVTKYFPCRVYVCCTQCMLVALTFSRGNKRVDDDLRSVEKVPELGLPDDKVPGALSAEAILVAEHGLLTEVAVGELQEGRLVGKEAVEGEVSRPRVLADQHSVPVAEGPPAHILAAQPDV